MMRLLGGRRIIQKKLRADFPRCWTGSHSSRATVEADPVCRSVVDDGRVVSVAHDCDVYVGHRAVVVVGAVSPVAAEEADAGIAETVIDSAVVTYFRSPVAGMPYIEIVFPSPVPGSPEQTDFRRLHPGARDPEIAVRAIGPISGNPDIAGFRADGLNIHRQRRRTNPNRNANNNLRSGLSWDRQ